MPHQLTMRVVNNILIFIATVLSVLHGQLLIAALLSVWFTYRSGAAWLLVAAVLIDGYFGAFFSVPYLTIVALLWYAFSEWIRPRLLLESGSLK